MDVGVSLQQIDVPEVFIRLTGLVAVLAWITTVRVPLLLLPESLNQVVRIVILGRPRVLNDVVDLGEVSTIDCIGKLLRILSMVSWHILWLPHHNLLQVVSK